jgi:hypothetical protein
LTVTVPLLGAAEFVPNCIPRTVFVEFTLREVLVIFARDPVLELYVPPFGIDTYPGFHLKDPLSLFLLQIKIILLIIENFNLIVKLFCYSIS